MHDIELDGQTRYMVIIGINLFLQPRSMLGTESGCNIIDWNGDLDDKVEQLKTKHGKSDNEIYATFLSQKETDNLVNQISPKIFEMIAAKTIMILFEGVIQIY